MTTPKKPAEPKTPADAPIKDPDLSQLRPGYIVFYEAAVYGEVDPVVHVGLVIHATDDRVRVKDLGPADESADFATSDVHLSN